jgi:hypothetical protein
LAGLVFSGNRLIVSSMQAKVKRRKKTYAQGNASVIGPQIYRWLWFPWGVCIPAKVHCVSDSERHSDDDDDDDDDDDE